MSNLKSAAIGFDNGNGYAKIVYRQSCIKLPSTIVNIHNGQRFNKGFTEYVDGSRSDLIGQSWLVGNDAQLQYPSNFARVVDELDGKVTYGLQLFLGALGNLNHQLPDELSLACYTSINDSFVWGDKLTAALSGEHIFRINSDRLVKLTLSNKTVEEGRGTVEQLYDGSTQIGVLDIGHGTIISSVYSDGEVIQKSRTVVLDGVDSLVTAIAKADATRLKLKREASKSVIIEGIEAGNFLYGTTGWCFDDIYISELKFWVKTNLSVAMKGIFKWEDKCSKLYAVGGGSSLPLISEALTNKGLTVVKDGQWVNAKGLYKLAYAHK